MAGIGPGTTSVACCRETVLLCCVASLYVHISPFQWLCWHWKEIPDSSSGAPTESYLLHTRSPFLFQNAGRELPACPLCSAWGPPGTQRSLPWGKDLLMTTSTLDLPWLWEDGAGPWPSAAFWRNWQCSLAEARALLYEYVWALNISLTLKVFSSCFFFFKITLSFAVEQMSGCFMFCFFSRAELGTIVGASCRALNSPPPSA